MSKVTNIILHIWCINSNENAMFEKINNYFTDQKGFVSLEDKSLPQGWYGGAKALETQLYCGAFNHLDLGKFIFHVKAQEWEFGDVVQIMVCEQESSSFRIINIVEDIWE